MTRSGAKDEQAASLIGSSRPKGPYVGPQPLREGDPLFGRDEEVKTLLNALVSERIVILLSPSGAGKTSLINAGLKGLLSGQGFKALGTFRVGGSALLPNADRGLFVGNLLQQWNTLTPTQAKYKKKELSKLKLKDFSERLISLAGENLPVLIFDQFEEAVTSFLPADDTALRNLFEDLGELLEDRRIWALFAMREDYLGGIEPFREYIEGGLRERQRLDFMTQLTAVEAICGPVEKFTNGRCVFEVEAAEMLAQRLRLVRNATTKELVLGKYVEPVLLQVVCSSIWDKYSVELNSAQGDHSKITLANVPDEENISDALSQFYNRVVADVAKNFNLLQETKVRKWFEEELTDGLMRRQTLKGPTHSSLDEGILRLLIDEYLIRPDVRNETTWYELSHDRLVGPVKTANLARRLVSPKARLLKERADLWTQASEENKDDLLLRGFALRQIETAYETDYSMLPSAEARFIEASMSYRKRRHRERYLTYVMTAAILVATVAIGFAFYKGLSVKAQLALADKVVQTANAKGESANKKLAAVVAQEQAQTKRAALAEESLREERNQTSNALQMAQINSREAADALRRARSADELNTTLVAKNTSTEVRYLEEARRAESSEQKAELLFAMADSRAQTTRALSALDTSSHASDAHKIIANIKALLTQYSEPILDIRSFQALSRLIESNLAFRKFDFPGDGSSIGYDVERGEIVVADYSTIYKASLSNIEKPVTKQVFLDCDQGRLDGLRVGLSTEVAKRNDSAKGRVDSGCDFFANPTRIEISPDGRNIAAGFSWGELYVYSGGDVPKVMKGFRHSVQQLAYSYDGLKLAASSSAWSFAVYDIDPKNRRVYREPWWLKGAITLARSVRVVTAATFAGQKNELIVIGLEDGHIEVWSAKERKRLLQFDAFSVSRRSVTSLSYDRVGDRVIGTAMDRTLKIWKLSDILAYTTGDSLTNTNLTIDVGRNNYATSVSISPNGQIYATAEANGDLELWNATDQSHLADLPGHESIVNNVRFLSDTLLISTDGLESTRLWSIPPLATLQRLQQLSRKLGEQRSDTGRDDTSIPDFPKVTNPEKTKALSVLAEAEDMLSDLEKISKDTNSAPTLTSNRNRQGADVCESHYPQDEKFQCRMRSLNAGKSAKQR